MRTYLNQLVFDKEQFEHFLKGDGEFYYCDDTGELCSKQEINDWFTEMQCITKQEKQACLDEEHIYKSYNELCDLYDYHDDEGWTIGYIEVGDKIVMGVVQNG